MNEYASSLPTIASAIREVFSYLDRYRGNTFVVKIEDTLFDHPLFPLLIRDIVQLQKVGIRVIIVPGARKTIDHLLKTYESESQFHLGVRLTSEEAMPLVMLAAMTVSQQLLSQLSANGATGVLGNWVRARGLGVLKGIDYGKTGQVERIRSDAIQDLLDQDFIPIVANLGWNKLGQIYNINSNEIASALCAKLNVTKLLMITPEGGLKADGFSLPEGVQASAKGVLHEMTVDQAKQFLTLNQEALPYSIRDALLHSLASCETGVERVHFVSGISEGAMIEEIFSSRDGGTMIYGNDYSVIRQAKSRDIPELLKMMDGYMKMESLVPRTAEDILPKIDDYIVYEVDQQIQGCGALHILREGFAELAAIAVEKEAASKGAGSRIVKTLLTRAKLAGVKKVYLLTTQASDWFLQLGFKFGSVSDLPESAQTRYNKQRNSKVMILEF